MDIQKEREAFEELIDIEIIISEGFKFNPNINQYYHPDHTNHRLSYAYLMGAWMVWQEKAQTVPEKTVKLHLVWNENRDECVGFLDSKDARYTATGDDRGMFGVTALGDYFRDLNDERDEFETQIVMIEAQEQKSKQVKDWG